MGELITRETTELVKLVSKREELDDAMHEMAIEASHKLVTMVLVSNSSSDMLIIAKAMNELREAFFNNAPIVKIKGGSVGGGDDDFERLLKR